MRKEALWAVCNATEGGSEVQLAALVERGAVQGIVSCLSLSDARLLQVALDGLLNFAQVGLPVGGVLCVCVFSLLVCMCVCGAHASCQRLLLQPVRRGAS